jgi:drug/metabolite transporter (DMT)-like permease
MSTEQPPTRILSLVAAFGAVYIIWGSTYLAIRFAIETIPPFLMAGARFLIAGALVYGWARLRGTGAPQGREWRAAVVVGGLLLLGGNGGVVWSEQWVPSGLAALLVTTVPLWMVILDWLRHEGRRPSVKTVIGLFVGFLGVGVLIGPSAGVSGNLPWIPCAVLILASLSWSAGSVYSRRAPLPEDPILATGMGMLAGGTLLMVLATFHGDWVALDLGSTSLKSALGFVYLILFGSIVAFSAYVWLLRKVSAAQASTYAFVNPAVAVFLGWALADEALTPRILIASGLIIAAVMLVTLRRPVRRRPAHLVPSGESDETADAGTPNLCLGSCHDR